MNRLFLTATFLALGAVAAQAQHIEKACLRSDRDAKSPALCSCIQQAANMTLNPRDRKLAASFYRDPSRVQEIRQSDRGNYARFWERYKIYLETAQAICG